MIRARKTSRWLLVLAFTMRLSSLCWLAVTSIGTGAGMIGTLPKALHYTISFMGHDTSLRYDSERPESGERRELTSQHGGLLLGPLKAARQDEGLCAL